jgi:hypothetical protein
MWRNGAAAYPSGCLAVIVAQKSTESFATLYGLFTRRLRHLRKQQHIAFALVVSLRVIVRKIILQRSPHAAFTKQNQFGQTFLLY